MSSNCDRGELLLHPGGGLPIGTVEIVGPEGGKLAVHKRKQFLRRRRRSALPRDVRREDGRAAEGEEKKEKRDLDPSDSSLGRAGRVDPAQIVIGIEASVMTVAPGRLERIATDEIPAAKLETLVGVTDVRPNDLAHYIRLATAGRAGAGRAQEAERKKGFAPVVPFDGEFVPDLLDVLRLEAHERSLAVIRSAGQPFARLRILLLSGTTGVNNPSYRQRHRGQRPRVQFAFRNGSGNNFGFFPAFLCS